MSERTDRFIEAVGRLARGQYLRREKWVLPSVCIAQAAVESGWDLEARTLFGIKGSGADSAVLPTSEYIGGRYTDTAAAFRTYPGPAEAVAGYYDLITGLGRYAGAVNNPDAEDAVRQIAAGGYATSPVYAQTVIGVLRDFDLTVWDARPSAGGSEEKPAAPAAAQTDGPKPAAVTVRPGDSFWSIARDFLGDGRRYAEVARANGLGVSDTIYAGQTLRLPDAQSSGRTVYTVRPGDTLWGISERFFGDGSRCREIAAANGIADPDLILPGRQLLL